MLMLHPLHLVFFFGFVTLTSAGLYDFRNLELARYDEEVKIIHDQLIEEGCQDVHIEKRALLTIENSQVKLEMKKKLYEKMIDMLVECRKAKLEKNKPLSTTITAPKTKPATSTATPSTTPATTSTTTTPTTKTTPSTSPTATSTTATTTPTTTTQSPTTQIPQPAECYGAANLTETWRLEHNGANIKPRNGKYNCDPGNMVKAGRRWFRFSGAAGNRLLNKCVGLPIYSCGTTIPMWSDDATPTSIGVISQITAYVKALKVMSDANCRYWKKKVSIMRCSNKPHDFVYRYDDHVDFCDAGFCGMSA